MMIDVMIDDRALIFICNCTDGYKRRYVRAYKQTSTLTMDVQIVEIGDQVANDEGLEMAVAVAKEAFESHADIENIIRDLHADPTAKPILSLLALQSGVDASSSELCCVGQVLISTVRLDPNPSGWKVAILAPLAVSPPHQRQTVGTKLVEFAMTQLKVRGVDLVFVLGHPKYYPRFGFRPAGQYGFLPQYTLKESQADAWMVMSPNTDTDVSTLIGIGEKEIQVVCADSLNKPQYWTEP